jgi:hypothetical protein
MTMVRIPQRAEIDVDQFFERRVGRRRRDAKNVYALSVCDRNRSALYRGGSSPA